MTINLEVALSLTNTILQVKKELVNKIDQFAERLTGDIAIQTFSFEGENLSIRRVFETLIEGDTVTMWDKITMNFDLETGDFTYEIPATGVEEFVRGIFNVYYVPEFEALLKRIFEVYHSVTKPLSVAYSEPVTKSY